LPAYPAKLVARGVGLAGGVLLVVIIAHGACQAVQARAVQAVELYQHRTQPRGSCD
jgi:hypothetical protein